MVEIYPGVTLRTDAGAAFGSTAAPFVVSSSPAVITATLGGSAAPAIVAAADYASGDVISQSATVGTAWLLPGMSLIAGGSGEVVGGILTLSSSICVNTFRLWLFNANPADSMKNDNVAFSLHANDQAKLVNFVDFAAAVPLGGVAGALTAAISKPYTTAAVVDLYGILQVTSAYANEVAGETVIVKLMVKRG